MSWKPAAFLAALLFLPGPGIGHATAQELTLADVQRIVAERGYSWTPGQTSVSQLPADFRRRYQGLRVPVDAELIDADRPVIRAPASSNLPPHWDWRDHVPGLHPWA